MKGRNKETKLLILKIGFFKNIKQYYLFLDAYSHLNLQHSSFNSLPEMIVILVCALSFFASLLAADVKDYKSIYIKSFRCNVTEKFIHKNFTCFAKSWSRNYSTANAYACTKFPLYNITVSFVLLHSKFVRIDV